MRQHEIVAGIAKYWDQYGIAAPHFECAWMGEEWALTMFVEDSKGRRPVIAYGANFDDALRDLHTHLKEACDALAA